MAGRRPLAILAFISILFLAGCNGSRDVGPYKASYEYNLGTVEIGITGGPPIASIDFYQYDEYGNRIKATHFSGNSAVISLETGAHNYSIGITDNTGVTHQDSGLIPSD